MKNLSIITLILFTSCGTKNDKTLVLHESSINKDSNPHTHEEKKLITVNKKPTNDSIKSNHTIQPNRPCMHSIVDNMLANSVIDVKNIYKSGVKTLFNRSYKVFLSRLEDNHDLRYIDSVYTFEAGSSRISMTNVSKYDSINGTTPFWLNALIQDNSIKVYKGLQVGMNKGLFFKTINHNYNVCDSIRITNDEQNYEHYFVFKKDRLSKIILQNLSD